MSSQILTVSEKVSQEIFEMGLVKKEKLSHINLGFDMDKIREQRKFPSSLRKNLGISSDALVAGVIGRLVPVKGVDFFLEALEPLLASYPKLHLVIVGDGPEKYNLEQKVLLRMKSEFQPRIHFAGWILPLVPEYKDFNVVVCSSQNEGTSVAVIEAVLCGIPVVSVKVGGMPDLLEGGKWGLICERNRLELQNAVEKIILGQGLSTDQIRSAQAHFEVEYDEKALCANMHGLYQKLLSSIDKA